MGFRINNPLAPPIPVEQRLPLPTVGMQVELSRHLKLASGPIGPSALTVAAAFYDAFGRPFVNLSRDGRVIVCGVSWPLGAAQ